MNNQPRKFYFREHMHKGKTYVDALKLRGFQHIKNLNHKTLTELDAIFLDHDINATGTGRRTEVYKAYEYDIPLFIYPHSARPNIMYDLWRAWPFVKCCFVISRGHKRVLQKVNYPCPIEITGWAYTDIVPFRPSKPIGKIKVLFAPIHPIGSGYLHEIDRQLNLKVFRLLLNMPDVEIYVRYLGRLEENGLFRTSKAKFYNGQPDGTFDDILEADLVISAYTHAYMTVALGKPLMMMGECEIPHAGNQIWTAYSLQWNKYREYMRYPFNVEEVLSDPEAALEMMKNAMAGSKAIGKWKKKFIGKKFDGNYFYKKVNKYIDKHDKKRRDIRKVW